MRRRPGLGSRKSLLDEITDFEESFCSIQNNESDQDLDDYSDNFVETPKSRFRMKNDDKRNEFLYVLAIDKNAHPIMINWLVELLKRNGLILAKLGQQTRVEHRLYKTLRTEEILLAVAAPLEALKEAAQTMKLTSSRPDNVLRSRHVDVLLADSIFDDEEYGPETENVRTNRDDLTRCEKERCLLHILENIQSDQSCKDVLLGYPSVFVYPGQSLIPICHRERIITRYFPLHNRDFLRRLETEWLWRYQRQPINSIRAYFGESIAFYFAFMEFYTIGLIVPSLLGLIQYFFFSAKFDAFFSLLSILYLTVFLKIWKRRSSEYAYEWGTLKSEMIQKPRAMFRAKLIYDHKKKQQVLTYPIQRTIAKVYLVSLPIVLLCLFCSLKMMLFFLALEDLTLTVYPNDDYHSMVMTTVPGIVYAILVWLKNRSYQGLAERLTEYENHRTQSSHDSHLIVKLALFEFWSNFGSIFYIGYVKHDVEQVRRQIGSLLLVGQLIENFIEVFVPYLTYYTNIELPLQRRLSVYKKLDQNLIFNSDSSPDEGTVNYESVHTTSTEIENGPSKTEKDEFIKEAFVQNHMPEYESTYNDHLEIFIQIGYVYMFSSVHPLAALFAFINNVIEIRSDAFKLLRIYQRPSARIAKGINPAWMKAFEVISLLSVTTFCAHIGVSSFMQEFKSQWKLDQTEYVLLIVLIEHVTLGIILIISYVIPDQPKHIREKFHLLYSGTNSSPITLSQIATTKKQNLKKSSSHSE